MITTASARHLICCLTLLACSFVVEATDPGKNIVIVKSSDNSYFNQTIESLARHVELAHSFNVVTADALARGAEIVESNAVLIALGEIAVEAVMKRKPDASIINAYLTLEQYLRLQPSGRQISVLLDQPLHRYLNFCRLLFPMESIGIINYNNQTAELNNVPGLLLNRYSLTDTNNLLPLLRELLHENDALLMLPQQAIYNHVTLKAVLLTAYRSRKPVISYSPAHVMSGALASIYSSPEDIGRHIALLVNRLQRAESWSAPAFHYARYFSINTNPSVAHALNIALPEVSVLRAKLEQADR